MNTFYIRKSELNKNFTGIYTPDLGKASGELKLSGLRLYLYLAGNKDGMRWTVNPSVYASWLGEDYNQKGRAIRKSMNDGISDLIEHGYLVQIDEDVYEFREHSEKK